jgi:hypothetical protein
MSVILVNKAAAAFLGEALGRLRRRRAWVGYPCDIRRVSRRHWFALGAADIGSIPREATSCSLWGRPAFHSRRQTVCEVEGWF